MKIVDKYLNILRDLRLTIVEEEMDSRLRSMKKIDKQATIEVTDSCLVNEETGDPATDEIDAIVKYFSFEEEEYIKEKIFFRDFLRISTYLGKEFGISPKEAYQIIALIAKRNHEIAVSSPSMTIVDIEALNRIKFNSVTNSEVEKIFRDNSLLTKIVNNEGLDDEQKIQRREIQKHLNEFVQDYSKICKINDAFYLGFVCKFPNIDPEDIVDARNRLKQLGVKDSLISSLLNYFMSIFRSNMQKSTVIFDMSLYDVYLEMLVEDDDERKDIHNEMVRHNNLVNKRIESEINSMMNSISKDSEEKQEVKRYLTEKEVKELKKYIRAFYDMYHAKLVSLPNYQELLNCVDKMELLEEEWYVLSRFLNLAITEVLKADNYISNYDELITLVGYLIKYKVDRNAIDMLIRKYKSLRVKSDDLIECMKDSLEEIRLYDVSLAEDIEDLLKEVSVSTKEDYDAIVLLLEECLKEAQKYQSKTDYEYNLALVKIGR